MNNRCICSLFRLFLQTGQHLNFLIEVSMQHRQNTCPHTVDMIWDFFFRISVMSSRQILHSTMLFWSDDIGTVSPSDALVFVLCIPVLDAGSMATWSLAVILGLFVHHALTWGRGLKTANIVLDNEEIPVFIPAKALPWRFAFRRLA